MRSKTSSRKSRAGDAQLHTLRPVASVADLRPTNPRPVRVVTASKRVWVVSRYAKQRESVAQAIGQQLQLPVERVDLSKTVSKYIAETEKNLSKLFAEAEGRDCVLFFDEADALFGKRAEVEDAQERFAHPEVSYFFAQLERSKRPVVVAARRKQHLDPAFIRRLRMSVVTPLPLPKVRVRKRPSSRSREP